MPRDTSQAAEQGVGQGVAGNTPAIDTVLKPPVFPDMPTDIAALERYLADLDAQTKARQAASAGVRHPAKSLINQPDLYKLPT